LPPDPALSARGNIESQAAAVPAKGWALVWNYCGPTNNLMVELWRRKALGSSAGFELWTNVSPVVTKLVLPTGEPAGFFIARTRSTLEWDTATKQFAVSDWNLLECPQ
jgi:hypothetical protein